VDLFAQLDTVASRHDVLRHPFYRRWSAGELTREELAVYAGQYHHAVVALADAAEAAAAKAHEPAVREQLEGHAAEEREHVALWESFTRAVGGRTDASPAPETAACAHAWAGAADRPLLPSLVALYAVEAAQPAISQTKRAGLAEHYGIEGDGAAYFALHETLDVHHAEAGRALIEQRADSADEPALVAEAERVLAANWGLLDGVERLNGRSAER
jgi:pyrroloquinoline-quinone synthase